MKRRIIILISTFLGIIGISIGGFFIVQRSPQLQNSVAKLGNISNTNTRAITNTTTVPTTDQYHLADLKTVSRIFAERYGSTSNQEPTALSSVLQYSSARLSAILQTNIAQLAAREKPEVTITTITHSYVITPTNITTSSASVVVGTIREETVGTGVPVVTKQDLRLNVVRENNVWRIDQAEWGTSTPYGN